MSAPPPRLSLQPACDVGEFLRAPIGRYLAGSGFVVWTFCPTLIGNCYLGRMTAEDLERLALTFHLPGHPALTPPFDAVIDGSLLSTLDLTAYEALSGYVSSYLEQYLPSVRRIAVLRPPGLTGLIVAGLYHDVLMGKVDAGLFDDYAAAFAWLNRPDSDQARAVVLDLYARVQGVPAVVRRLRDFLAARIEQGDTNIHHAAQSLGMSARTLQRQLHAAGTSFRIESSNARIGAAQLLLTQSQAKLTEIARRVGCASPAHLSSLFQSRTGQPPSRLRGSARR